jgi:hypothetical protein
LLEICHWRSILGVNILKKVFADEQQVFDLVYSQPAQQQQTESCTSKDDIENEDEGREHVEGCSRSLTREQTEVVFDLVKAERTSQVLVLIRD